MKQSTYRNYLITILLMILAVNYIDRLALGLLLQDIKVDLSLSDTQLGFLGGIAFALFYAVMGIPIARWADRGNRVIIISLTAIVWSAATALCGAAASFVQLVLIRIGVATGEAGCYPASLSLIADSFNRAERPRAVARFMLGVPVALVVGNLAIGWLNELYGWRATFAFIGVPGLALGAIAAFSLKEPRTNNRSVEPEGGLPRVHSEQPSFKEVWITLWANSAYRNLLFCFSIWGFFGNGILQWQPAFFVRSHGLSSGQLGTWFAAVYGIGGFIGTYWGGELGSRYAANNERLQLIGIAILYALLAILTAGVYLAPNHHMAFAALTFTAIGGAAANGPLFAVTQTLVPPNMRAMSIAVMYFFCNLFGMGLGPLMAGALSDSLRPWFGDEALRYALLALTPGYFWCSWHLWRASRTVTHDLAQPVYTPLAISSAGLAD